MYTTRDLKRFAFSIAMLRCTIAIDSSTPAPVCKQPGHSCMNHLSSYFSRFAEMTIL